MALDRGTQKQIAQRFKGNLDYFAKPHYWRRLRFWTILLVVLGGTAAMAYFYFRGPESIYNPGPISQHHAHFAGDCSKCHEPHDKTFAGATFKFTNEGIDQRCEKCHAGRSFHQPSVAREMSCTACHQEHQTSGSMRPTTDAHCASCHGNAHEMAASADKGKTLPAQQFDYRPSLGWIVFKPPRPERGYTQLITSFDGDHPEFQVRAANLRETNTLKFNHRRHLVETNDIPLINGKRLDCAYCHQPGPGGTFMQRMSYEANCKACHSLQFDERNPDLLLPHGRAEHVRAFLRSLPTHYAELAERKGMNKAAMDEFVTAQMTRMRDNFESGTNLEHKVFFPDAPDASWGRAKFRGCTECHEVRAAGNNVPQVTSPVIPDRWMMRAHFNHAKHTTVACTKCHNAPASTDTAEILMPGKASCIECHSPKGAVAHNCATCHTYHTRGAQMTMSAR